MPFVSDEECSSDYIKISFGDNTVPKRICRHLESPFNTTSNTLKLTFFSDNNPSKHNGFALFYQAKDSTEYITEIPCGEILNGVSYLQSPNSPSDYPPNLNCLWTIPVKTDEIVTFTLISVDLEQTVNCSADVLEISGINEQNVHRFCGSFNPTNLRLSYDANITIRFRSDMLFGGNFKLEWQRRVIKCAGGVTYNAPSGSFSNYPGLYEGGDFNCKWTITVDDNSVVELTIDDFYVPCGDHRIYVEESGIDLTHGDNFCGNIVEKPLRSRTNSVTIHYQYLGYNNVNDAHFNMSWKAIDACTEMTASRGIITSPGYPNKYPNNADLCWEIKIPYLHYIIYHIIEMDMEASFGCMADYLFVKGDLLYGDYKLCGVWSRWSFAFRDFTIKMHSDDSVEKRGFALLYSKGDINGTSEDRSCGPGNLIAPTGFITSPGYPLYYQPNEFCEWTVTAIPGQVIEVKFLRVNMPFVSDEECSNDYIEISFGDNTVPKRICRRPGSPFNTTSNTLKLTFSSDNNTFRHAHFALFYEAKDSTESITEIPCGGILNRVSYLQSPNYPSDYSPNLNCLWTIPVKTDEIVTFTLISIDLEQTVNCSADVLEISGINDKSVHRFCGDFYSSNLSFSYDADITIRFRSDMLFGGNFELEWQRRVIGGLL